MLETALASGIVSMGADVLLVGPMPTPGVAFLTRSMRADAGVVISASHNPYQDNGIKFFSWDGFKLPDEVEARMEEMIFSGVTEESRPTASEIGKAFRLSDAVGRYNVFLKNSFPRHLTLEGLKIVVDCGHGAAYKVVPEVLSELGAEVLPIGVQPDGENINRRCGALYPETAREVLLHEGADFAVSLDGDADRAIFIDETGDILDGDQVLAIAALDMQQKGILKGSGVVATVMSNLGLELALRDAGLGLVRTQVGDRYVVEKMVAGNYNLGGEQSGHILFLDHNTTGDGAITCLQMLALMVEKRQRLSALKRVMTRLPQVLLNIDVKERRDLATMPRSVKRSPRWKAPWRGEGGSWCAIPAPSCWRESCWKARTKKRSAPWPRISPIGFVRRSADSHDSFGSQRRSRRDGAPGAPRGSPRSGRGGAAWPRRPAPTASPYICAKIAGIFRSATSSGCVSKPPPRSIWRWP